MGLKNFGLIDNTFVESTRKKFIEKFQDHFESSYYSEDVDKVLNSDWFIKRFLILAYKNEEDAVKYLHQALVWRKEFRIRDIEDNYFPKEFFQMGGLFLFEEDKNGISSVICRVECLKKTPELTPTIKKFMMHQIFKVDERTDGSGYVMVFDFHNCGYSAYEHLDLLKFFVTTMHYYFPAGLDYVLVCNLPWMLKTVWNVVKYWIPPKRRSMIQFANGSQILEYFDIDKLPEFLGGTSKKKYKEPPANCPSGINFGMSEVGLTEEEIKRLMDTYKQYLT